MPNHVTQQLTISGDGVSKVIEHIAGVESAIDFNKIISMPEALQVEDSSKALIGRAAITGQLDEHLTSWAKDKGLTTVSEFIAYVERERPDAIELARKHMSNEQKYGVATWYEWSLRNWGTKWNAYSVSTPEVFNDSVRLRYDTAWSPAFPVIVRLSELFPSAKLMLKYFDEGWGFAGEANFHRGETIDDCFKPDVKDLRSRSIYREVYGVELSLETDS